MLKNKFFKNKPKFKDLKNNLPNPTNNSTSTRNLKSTTKTNTFIFKNNATTTQ